MTPDLTISGSGFYRISGQSSQGKDWIAEHVQGGKHGETFSEDLRLAADIAEEAFEAGLTVEIHGHIYAGGFKLKA